MLKTSNIKAVINQNLYIFGARTFLLMLARSLGNRTYNPRELLKTSSTLLWGLFIISIFVLTAVQNSQTVNNLEQASNDKIEFIKYKRGKNLIQREHPSNDQLPSTGQGLHLIPNNPAKGHGGSLDCTKGNSYNYITLLDLLIGDEDKGRTV